MNYKDAVNWIKAYKAGNETVIIQTYDLNDLFAYYYSPTCFADYHNLDSCLKSENVYTANDSVGLSKLRYAHTDHLFLIQSFNGYADPKNTIMGELNKEYHCIKTE